jgi:hypothetical protein
VAEVVVGFAEHADDFLVFFEFELVYFTAAGVDNSLDFEAGGKLHESDFFAIRSRQNLCDICRENGVHSRITVAFFAKNSAFITIAQYGLDSLDTPISRPIHFNRPNFAVSLPPEWRARMRVIVIFFDHVQCNISSCSDVLEKCDVFVLDEHFFSVHLNSKNL